MDVLEKRKEIKREWIIETLKNPDYVERKSDKELRFWKAIKEYENRYLRVVYNPQSSLVVTAFFDRTFKRRFKNENKI